MTPPQAGSGPLRAALFHAGWPELCDRLLAGVCHDLNGRASALVGVSHLLSIQAGGDARDLIGGEVQKLERLARLLRLLTGDPDRAPEPLAPAELLPLLVDLQSREAGMDDVRVVLETDPEAPPVLVNWSAFGRVFMLALSAVARGSDGTVRVTSEPGDDGGLRLTIGGRRGDGDGTSLAAAAEALGGGLDAGEEAIILTLPSLEQARRG